MSREIATGRSMDCSKDKDSGNYFYRITYCTDDRYKYPTAKRTGQCLEYGGPTSFERCLRCPDLHRLGHEYHQVEPYLRVELCITGDFRHDPRRAGCRQCTQRLVCLSEQLRKVSRFKKRVRLIVYEGK